MKVSSALAMFVAVLSANAWQVLSCFLMQFPFPLWKNYSSTATITTKWRWCNTNIKRTSISFWVSFKHWPLSTSAHFLSANNIIRYVIQLRWPNLLRSFISTQRGPAVSTGEIHRLNSISIRSVCQAPTIVLMPSHMTNTLDTGLWAPPSPRPKMIPSSKHTKICWFGSMSLWTFWSTLCR